MRPVVVLPPGSPGTIPIPRANAESPPTPPTDDAARSDPHTAAPNSAQARSRAPRPARPPVSTPPAPRSPWVRRRALRLWRRLRTVALAGAVGLLAGLVVLMLAGWAMVRGSPTWWRQVDPSDPRTIAWAEAVHRAVGQHLTERRTADPSRNPDDPDAPRWQSEPWSVRLEPHDANAWLNVELPRWLNASGDGHAWPNAFSQLQVEFREDQLFIGVRVEADGRSQVLSASLRPEVRADGSLWVPADWVHIGRLPIPAPWVLGEAEQRLPDLVPDELRRLPETRAMLRAFAGEHAIVQEPIVRLPDDRYVRLLNIRARHGRLEITCRTEAR